jgi:hypothetical protein
MKSTNKKKPKRPNGNKQKKASVKTKALSNSPEDHHNKRFHYFFNRLSKAFNKMVTQKLTIAPTAAKIPVLTKSALFIFTKMVSSVPAAVPALVVLSK